MIRTVPGIERVIPKSNDKRSSRPRRLGGGQAGGCGRERHARQVQWQREVEDRVEQSEFGEAKETVMASTARARDDLLQRAGVSTFSVSGTDSSPRVQDV